MVRMATHLLGVRCDTLLDISLLSILRVELDVLRAQFGAGEELSHTLRRCISRAGHILLQQADLAPPLTISSTALEIIESPAVSYKLALTGRNLAKPGRRRSRNTDNGRIQLYLAILWW